MDIGDQFETEHLYFSVRKCRICGETKDLIDGFYRIRKNKYNLSSYAYECKKCAVNRITSSRKSKDKKIGWEYPDW